TVPVDLVLAGEAFEVALGDVAGAGPLIPRLVAQRDHVPRQREEGRPLQRRVALGRTPGFREDIHAVPVAPVGGGDDEAVVRHRTQTRPDVKQVGDLRALVQQRPGGAGTDTGLARGALTDDLVGLGRVFEV